MTKKVKKEACIIVAIWRKILKVSRPKSVFFLILGQIAPIMETFSKGQKKHNHNNKYNTL